MSTDLAPVVATVTVPCDVATAFDVFVHDMGSWWPVLSHSLGAERVTSLAIDGRVGGELVEVWDDGTRRPWAVVTAWDPPYSLGLAWNPVEDPSARPASDVVVRFAPDGDATVVTLTHTGWERWGPELRAGYEEGWPIVLGLFDARCRVTGV
jgi:hypothetical protein